MPNIKSAKKRVLVNAKKTEQNKAIRSAVKTEMKIQVGEKVLFSKYAGVEIKMDNELFMVLRQIDVLGVFDE